MLTSTLSLWLLSTLVLAAPISIIMPSSMEAAISVIEAAVGLPTTTQTNEVTYFYQNEVMGACGLYSNDAELVVGLPLEFYNDTGIISSYCGTFIQIFNSKNNITVSARVADASAANSTLALSIGTWQALQGEQSLLDSVQWRFATPSQTREIKLILATQSATPIVLTPISTSIITPESTTPAPIVTPTPAPYSAPTPVYAAPVTAPIPPPAPVAKFTGGATYYTQDGAYGACGAIHSDSDYIIAIPSSLFSMSLCGKSVTVTRGSNGKSITATVADKCPGCEGASLDLSVAAFNSLADPSVGRFDQSWSWN